MPITLEVCVEDAQGVAAAIAAGADRIELCSALDVGGLTPSAGLMQLARSAPIPVYAMIRPRAGSFHFDSMDEQVMLADIDKVREARLAGVVLGASLPDGHLDTALLRRLVARADGLGLTLHRVFDLVPSPLRALDEAVELGFERILTSGGERHAAQALPLLKQLVEHGRGRISIMPGSGVNADNAAEILAATGAHEIHASCRAVIAQAEGRSLELGFSTPEIMHTSGDKIRQLRALIKSYSLNEGDGF